MNHEPGFPPDAKPLHAVPYAAGPENNGIGRRDMGSQGTQRQSEQGELLTGHKRPPRSTVVTALAQSGKSPAIIMLRRDSQTPKLAAGYSGPSVAHYGFPRACWSVPAAGAELQWVTPGNGDDSLVPRQNTRPAN